MNEDVKLEREKRKRKRQRKKIRSTVVAITLILIIASVGVVNAQTQGYEIRYQGQSLGFIRTPGILESAVLRIEEPLRKFYNNESIVFGSGFELVQGRVEDPMDLETCIQVLNNQGIELYANGAAILIGDQEIGAVASLSEAQRVMDAYHNLYPNGKSMRYIETKLPLSETMDLGTMLSKIEGIVK